MSLSLASRRHDQTSSSLTSSSSSTWSTQKQNSQQQHKFYIRKQHSFIETGQQHRSAKSNVGRGYLQRGLSVGRSHDNLRQKAATSTAERQSAKENQQQRGAVGSSPAAKTLVAWQPSGPLLQRALDNELARVDKAYGVNKATKDSKTCKRASSLTDNLVSPLGGGSDGVGAVCASGGKTSPQQQQQQQSTETPSPLQPVPGTAVKKDANKINLSIVLSPTTADRDPYSDIDSSSEAVDAVPSLGTAPFKRFGSTQVVVESQQLYPIGGKGNSIASTRRNQFNTQRPLSSASVGNTTPTSSSSSPTSGASTATPTVPCSAINNNFSASPSLTVQRRPPLVRAMSAPVRTLDEHNKSVSVANSVKRKIQRRRKLAPPSNPSQRQISCDIVPEERRNSKGDLLLDDGDGARKLLGSRIRSAGVSTDIITLVSLISSEGSDSEHEDTARPATATTTTTSVGNTAENSPSRRAPSLRKTGKSVSFQENYPPNFQLASKEYSHMIRRSSIAPVEARLRSNRPPTAPPVSIYLKEPLSNEMSVLIKDKADDSKEALLDANASKSMQSKQSSKSSNDLASPQIEYVYPEYVRSVKERECWKLYQKMCAKGVSVTYDTILRGMLTPTEFRQLQKQRDIEEAKAREAEELLNESENAKPPPTAIERLSESLLKK